MSNAREPGNTGNPSIRIPKAVAESLNAPPCSAEFAGQGMTGAQVFANLCKDEELPALFCAAGNYHIIDEIAQVGIPCYGGRTEGGMCAAADGFSRVTGEVAACSGTEGPGITHMIMNIGSAHAANSALLVLASNSSLRSEDCQSFIQFMYQQPLTEGMKKYGKRITVTESDLRIWRLRIPESEIGCARCCAPRFPGGGGDGAFHGCIRTRTFLWQGTVSRRIAGVPGIQGSPASHRHDQ